MQHRGHSAVGDYKQALAVTEAGGFPAHGNSISNIGRLTQPVDTLSRTCCCFSSPSTARPSSLGRDYKHNS